MCVSALIKLCPQPPLRPMAGVAAPAERQQKLTVHVLALGSEDEEVNTDFRMKVDTTFQVANHPSII